MTFANAEEFKQALIDSLTHHRNQRFQEALEGYERVLAVQPDLPEIVNHAAMARFELGDTEEAIKGLNKAISLNPTYADAHTNLGNVLLDLKRDTEAMEAYKTAIMARAESPEAYYGLGEIFLQRGELDKAHEAFTRALYFKPQYLEAHKQLGSTLEKQHDHEGARQIYEKAASLFPEDTECLNRLGNLALYIGDMETARHHYARVLEIDPTRTGARMNLIRLDDSNGEVEALLEIAEQEMAEEADNYLTRYALGSALDKLGRYDEAFENYLEANRLKRPSYDYKPENYTALFQEIAATFNSDFLEGIGERGGKDWGDKAEAPIFILGMPRSGTTLTEQILGSHSRVQPLGELDTFSKLATGVRPADKEGVSYPHTVKDYLPGVFKEIGRLYLELSGGDASAPLFFTDKMPENFKFLGLIHLVFPNAKIIHCRRDPIDTCISCFMQNFASGQFFSYDLAELGKYYRDYAALMDHWEKVLPGRFLTVQYEDTVADLESQARRLLDHCGLPWEDQVLEFHKTDRPVWTASAGQVHKPIYTSSVARWQRYEKHLGPLVEALGPLVKG